MFTPQTTFNDKDMEMPEDPDVDIPIVVDEGDEERDEDQDQDMPIVFEDRKEEIFPDELYP